MNIEEDYGIGRSIKRVAEVRDFKKMVLEPVISDINRWQKIEWAKGMRPRFSMLEHYADVVLMLETSLQVCRPL